MNRILQFFFPKQPWHSSQTGAAKSRKSSKCLCCLPSILQGHWQELCSTTFHLGMHRLYVGVRCVRKHSGNKDASSSHLKLLGQGHWWLRVLRAVSAFWKLRSVTITFPVTSRIRCMFSALRNGYRTFKSSTIHYLVSWASGQITSLSIGEAHPSCRDIVELRKKYNQQTSITILLPQCLRGNHCMRTINVKMVVELKGNLTSLQYKKPKASLSLI